MLRYRRAAVYLVAFIVVNQVFFITLTSHNKKLPTGVGSERAGTANSTFTRHAEPWMTPLKNNGTVAVSSNSTINDDDQDILDIRAEVPQFSRATGPRIVSYKLGGGFRKTFAANVDLRKCKYDDCSFQFVPNDVTTYSYGNVSLDADAVIFQGNRLPWQPPQRRDENQVFVFFDMECPWYSHTQIYKRRQWLSPFNWTMTYRLDSDIPNQYASPVLWDQPVPRRNYRTIFRNKRKDVLWFVSHCETSSERELYTQELGQYITIDIFGACTKNWHSCSRDNRELCLQEAIKPYKFYLSFEHTSCRDYITEKYFSFLPLDIIPVVRGGGDYSSNVPNGTYINTADFSSPKELAAYLKELGDSEKEYTKFMKVKAQYKGVERSYQNSFCSLCEKLHNLPENKKTYNNIVTWWTRDACVSGPKVVPTQSRNATLTV